jgi:hypothetical protein
MTKDKVLLGRLKRDAGSDIADGENIWLSKHSWDCGWYWGFGYLGNKNCHFHFESLLYIKKANGACKYVASDLFDDTKITDKEWWIMRDLFVQAYALQAAAEVYRHGGHQGFQAGLTNMIVDETMAARVNADLEKVLDALWTYVVQAVNKPEIVEVE